MFTKGPWIVKHSESKTAFNVIGTVLGGKYKIARCPYVVTNNGNGIDKKEKAEAEANAKLISTAPEMLDALYEAKNTIRRLKLSMMAHPDCQEGSEFDDYTDTAQEVEEKLVLLIKKVTR
jgi:hypothetical protein